jgi:hypothetical protein
MQQQKQYVRADINVFGNTRIVCSNGKFTVFVNFTQMVEAGLYLVVVQCLSYCNDDLQDWVSVLQKCLAIPSMCALGLQA